MADKRELVLELLARDKTAQATRSAAKNLDDVADASADAGREADRLGKASVAAGQDTDRFGKAASLNARLVDGLGDEISSLQQDLVFLAQQFAETNDKAQRLDISRGIRRAENDIRRLSKSRGVLEALLPDPADVAQEGLSLGAKLGQSVIGGMSSLAAGAASKGPALAIGAAVVTTAGPVIAGGLSAAVIGGIGAGGILGGAALVAKNPAVAGAASAIGRRFTDNLKIDATRAFEKPMLRSLSIVDRAASTAGPKFAKIFANVAPGLEPLVGKITRVGDVILDSLVGASERSGPALDALGDSVVLVGQGVGNFIDILSRGGPQAADNLRLIAGATGDLIAVTGYAIEGFGKLGNLIPFAGAGMGKLKQHYRDTADATEALTPKTELLALKMDDAARAARGERDAHAGLSRQLRGEIDPAFGLINAKNELRVAQDKAAAATRKYGVNSEQARAATRNLALAAIDLQGKAGALGANFDGKLTPSLRRTLQAAGLTAGQMDAVEHELKAAKTAANKWDGTYAEAKIVTRYITTKENFVGPVQPGSPYSKRAAGGPVRKGVPYIVGEERPEVFVPDRDGRIVPSVQQFAAASARQGPMGGGGWAPAAPAPQEVKVVVAFDFTGTDREMITIMRRAIRTVGALNNVF